MPHRSFLITVTSCILLCSFSARSQEPAPQRKLNDTEAAAVRKKAIDLLESVAGQVESLRSAENRARIGSNVAELLWDHDQSRSRSLFAAVQEDIKVGLNDTDPDHAAHQHTLMVFLKLRSDVLDRIAKHDPDLALQFLRATRPPSDNQLPYQMWDGENALELRLAGQAAAKNPQLALKLGRQSLARGFSGDLLLVLSRLHSKDKVAAQSFYGEIVDKLKSANLARDFAATEIALNLARSFQPPEAEEQVYRDLIGVLLGGSMASGCMDATDDDPPQICLRIGSVFSKIEKYYPLRAAPLKRWTQHASDFNLPLPPQLQDIFENGTIEEILALAPKYPEIHGRIYWSAMVKAEASGDGALARKIASAAPDEQQRRDMLAQLDRGQLWKSMNQEQLATLQSQIAGLRNDYERIQVLFHMARRIGGNDRVAALRLLTQAGQIIDSRGPGKSRLEGQIMLALQYSSLKSDRGFAIMESVMPKLNELVSAAASLDGFENNYLRDEEWNMTGEGAVGALLTTLAQNAGYFARLDFDRSVTLASQFERAELRLMAHLKIAQSILANPNKSS